MDEFNNRIEAQRKVVDLINRDPQLKEQLFGLSQNAINRWILINGIDSKGEVVEVLVQISQKLFFLGTKSQEQVTKEYTDTSREIAELYSRLENAYN